MKKIIRDNGFFIFTIVFVVLLIGGFVFGLHKSFEHECESKMDYTNYEYDYKNGVCKINVCGIWFPQDNPVYLDLIANDCVLTP